MNQGELFKYLKKIRELQTNQTAIQQVREKLIPANAQVTDAKTELALIEELAGLARSGQVNGVARAILHILENECGLQKPVIFDSIMNAPVKATA